VRRFWLYRVLLLGWLHVLSFAAGRRLPRYVRYRVMRHQRGKPTVLWSRRSAGPLYVSSLCRWGGTRRRDPVCDEFVSDSAPLRELGNGLVPVCPKHAAEWARVREENSRRGYVSRSWITHLEQEVGLS